MPRIIPNLWFDGNAQQAVDFYLSIFPNSRITDTLRYTAAGPGPEGEVVTVDFELDGQPYVAINAGPEFTFDEAVSFMVEVDDQAELDRYWAALTDGGEEGPCGWLKDRFGLSWQVVPKGLNDLLRGEPAKATAATQCMYGQKKIDIAAIEAAAAAA
jgi:predicted 3-demethylubiquinone-9 3-methyltransferase (glyoxalase superfamily)